MAHVRSPQTAVRLGERQIGFLRELVVVLTEHDDGTGAFTAGNKSEALRLCVDACVDGRFPDAIAKARKRFLERPGNSGQADNGS